nr:MAG TPA: hypothetical protein [Caudoviricetes sp.]
MIKQYLNGCNAILNSITAVFSSFYTPFMLVSH